MSTDMIYVSLRRDRPMTSMELFNINERHCVIGKVTFLPRCQDFLAIIFSPLLKTEENAASQPTQPNEIGV